MLTMTAQTDSKTNPETTRFARVAGVRSRLMLVLVVLLLFSACVGLLLFAGGRAVALTKAAGVESFPGSRTAPLFVHPSQNYSKFSHSYPGAHAALSGRWSCAICHTRRDNSVEPKFPQHKDCISCHQTQFTTPDSPLCSICHTTEGLSQQNPPLKKFPQLKSFNTEFDHAQHTSGVMGARAQTGCVACHAPARRGVAKTIPASLGAHQTCYQCHTPGKQSGGVDISSCGACHGTGRPFQTSTAAISFRKGFSHAEHGQRQNLNCDSCHSVGARGLRQGRQVTSTFPAQHFPNTRAQSCMTCHNGQRTFGETNFIDCKRCHTGQTFRL